MNKNKCSYCGACDCSFVSNKRINRFTRTNLTLLKTPVCLKCFQAIIIKKLPIVSTVNEMDAVRKVSLIKSAAHGLSKKTPLHKIKDLCDELENIENVKKAAEYEFQRKALEAQECAKKVEWLRSCISDAKFIVSGKMQSSYEFCRKVANACCSDLETRNTVFSRDGFKCVLCGKDENLSVDHIKPVKLGGSNDLDNLQTLCLPCNLKKGWKFDGRKLRPKSRKQLIAVDDCESTRKLVL